MDTLRNVPSFARARRHPTVSSFNLRMHSSCPDCHHWLDGEQIHVTFPLRMAQVVSCKVCQRRLYALGGNSTHASFASSQATDPPGPSTGGPRSPPIPGDRSIVRGIPSATVVASLGVSDGAPARSFSSIEPRIGSIPENSTDVPSPAPANVDLTASSHEQEGLTATPQGDGLGRSSSRRKALTSKFTGEVKKLAGRARGSIERGIGRVGITRAPRSPRGTQVREHIRIS